MVPTEIEIFEQNVGDFNLDPNLHNKLSCKVKHETFNTSPVLRN